MPIRKDLQPFYCGPAWRKTRAQMLERAGNKCEACGVPNHTTIVRFRYRPGSWFIVAGAIHDQAGELRQPVLIVLTVAHLNHQPGDDRPENLKALCQWCHLNYDRPHHKETRAIRKDAARPLLEAAC